MKVFEQYVIRVVGMACAIASIYFLTPLGDDVVAGYILTVAALVALIWIEWIKGND
jgi:hypothetical protein